MINVISELIFPLPSLEPLTMNNRSSSIQKQLALLIVIYSTMDVIGNPGTNF